MIRRILREPLLHFLALGGALFVAFALASGDEAGREGRIVVTAGKVEQLGSLFARAWRRPPTREELDGLVRDWVREEAAYREALRLGLDRDDTVIRQRLRQKFEFMADDAAGAFEPSDDDLRAYLDANADAFAVEPRVSFRQVFLRPDRGEALAGEARELLTLLRRDAPLDASSLGDRTMLEHAHAEVSEREIAGLFGERFASAVLDLRPGAWEGPIASAFGAHLVIVDARSAGRIPELDDARGAVLRAWRNEQRQRVLAALYDELVGRYEVVVEPPAGGAR